MKNLPPTLTPDLLLRLYAGNPEAGERLTSLLRLTFAECEASRDNCSHLLQLFEADDQEPVAYMDLYKAQVRGEGVDALKRLDSAVPTDASDITRRASRVPADSRWGLVEALCEKSRRLASKDSERALVFGQAALTLAESVPLGPLSPSARHELLALSRATLANAFRVSDLMPSAEEAIERALSHLALAEDGPLGIAPSVLSLKASVDTAAKRFGVALKTLDRALCSCHAYPHSLEARLHVQRAAVYIYERQYAEALRDLDTAEKLLDPLQDATLWCWTKQHHLFIATELGQWKKADTLVEEVEGQLVELGNPAHLIKLRWCKARLVLSKGLMGEAEALYRETREAFLLHKLPYNAALATIELAQLLLGEGRLEQVKQYALETAAEFERQGVEPELIGAIALLEKAVVTQRLTMKLLSRIQRQLQRYEGRSRR